MRTEHNFIISTTSTLEGYDILQYLGTVSSHIVTGTGFFSDFAASFSDIFGGRSESYQKQLISIKDAVLSRLQNDAKRLGANAIIGLKIDFDEISGKGKQMFMVTGIGTAIIIKSRSKYIEDKEARRVPISSEELHERLRLSRIIDDFKKGIVSLEENTSELLIKYKPIEIVDPVLQELSSKDLGETDYNYYYRFYKNIFITYSYEIIKDILYNYLIKLTDSQRVCSFILDVINNAYLIDLNWIIKMLEHDNPLVRVYGVMLLQYDKEFYTENDLELLSQIKSMAIINIRDISRTVDSKGILGKRQKWICGFCGSENNVEVLFCNNCSRSKDGFLSYGKSLNYFMGIIDRKIGILETLFPK